jgi:hypothetical protein
LSGCFIGAVGLAALPLEIHEIQKVISRPRIAQRTVMRLEFDPVKLAQFSETVRLVSGIAPTHAGDGAQLRKPEAAIESFVLMAYEAVIEIDVVSDEDPVTHEPHEAVRDLGEYRRTADHLVRDAGDARKSRQRCDMLLRVVIDYLDAVATGVSDKDAACFRIECGVVEVTILPVRNP